jgi:ParB family chromosome partitioning protein
MSESQKQIVTIKISNIIIKDRIRKRFKEESIESLSESIKSIGLVHPISIDQDNVLIAGERRIRAYKLLGLEYIPTFIININEIYNSESIEIDENVQSEDFSVLEKLDIAQRIESRIETEYGERRGRGKKLKDFSSELDGPADGEKTLEFVARRSGFGNITTLRHAKTVVEDAISEVVEEMDKGNISIYRAKIISTNPRNKQLTALNLALKDPDTLAAELKRDQAARRKLKRQEKTSTPAKYKPHPIFNVIRVAPNWDEELIQDILETPVSSYAEVDCSYVAIEVNAFNLPKALECLDKWGFEYQGMVTVWDPKRKNAEPRLATTVTSWHIVLGAHINFDTNITLKRQPPVLVRYDNVQESLIHIIDEMFPGESDKRIDMTATEKRKNWICWKTSYGIDGDDSDFETETESPEPEAPFFSNDIEDVIAVTENVVDEEPEDNSNAIDSIDTEDEDEIFEKKE